MYRHWLPLLLGCVLGTSSGTKAIADPLLALEVLESYSWETMELQCKPLSTGEHEFESGVLRRGTLRPFEESRLNAVFVVAAAHRRPP